jgi:hypothetical protein
MRAKGDNVGQDVGAGFEGKLRWREALQVGHTPEDAHERGQRFAVQNVLHISGRAQGRARQEHARAALNLGVGAAKQPGRLSA